MAYPNKMMVQDRSTRQWEAMVSRAKGTGFTRTQEGPRYRPNDIVLTLDDPPSPARRRVDEFYRQRQVDAQREQKRMIVRAYTAAQPVSMRGAGAYCNDPELQYSERFIPMR